MRVPRVWAQDARQVAQARRQGIQHADHSWNLSPPLLVRTPSRTGIVEADDLDLLGWRGALAMAALSDRTEPDAIRMVPAVSLLRTEI